MFKTTKNQLNRMEEKIRQLHAVKTDDQKIAELELIIAAEMAALMFLRDLRAEPLSKRTAGMSGHSAGQRGPFSQSELDMRYGEDHRALEVRISELRALTGEDDAAWEIRTRRLRTECETMIGRKPYA